jgi:hypothetical protein
VGAGGRLLLRLLSPAQCLNTRRGLAAPASSSRLASTLIRKHWSARHRVVAITDGEISAMLLLLLIMQIADYECLLRQ